MNIPPRDAHAVLAALKRKGRSVLLEELGSIGGDGDVLQRLLNRLDSAATRGCELGYSYSFLLSWLVARVGPALRTSCEDLENDIHESAKGVVVAMPRWTLAIPMDGALQRRIPCEPLVYGDDAELARAYGGLMEHLAFLAGLPDEARRQEMLNTAVPWRVVALADRLEPEIPRTDGRPDTIASRFERLKGRTVGGARTRPIEREWWRSLGGDLCSRRHALSHVCESEGWTFTRCIESMWTLDEARAATAGIALAVLDHVRQHLRHVQPRSRMLDAVLEDNATAWLDHE